MSVIVALDLEGTLVSSAVSAFPRPGLRRFVERVLACADRVVMFTSVPERRARPLLAILEAEGELPLGFAGTVEFIPYSGPTKDLAVIKGSMAATVLLVDDQECVVHPGQERSWIRVAEFQPPFDETDGELERIAAIIEAYAV